MSDKSRSRQEGPRPPSQRQLRVGEELRHILARILERHDFRDPVLEHANLTVTGVDASPDLRRATVFVVPLGGGVGGGADAADKEQDDILRALNHAAPYLRRQVAGQVRMKFLPALTFRLDHSFEHAGRIDALLHDPRVLRDLGAPQGAEGDLDAPADDGEED
ncbi:MAG: 30S ribosome-binding factor RbfA [Rhodospirillales bacterium CG15_BIG_FIL_POST_REV_8_21_14_020_66_15]|nr:MAG: 30S ribosome-binding factor RbfA [Rhodospirillales bacterium CG15_BIG_FIL_POST_REV_8_21_14_020_66_15]